MSAKIVQIRECSGFSSEKPIVNVLFAPTGQNNKFAAGAFSEGERYTLSYDLRLIYPEYNVNGSFNAAAAFALFVKEIGDEQPVYLWDFSISDLTNGEHKSVKFERDGQIYSLAALRPATYHNDREKARNAAERSLYRQIDQKSVTWGE